MIIRLFPSTYNHLMLLPGSILSGLSVYFILSYLLVPVTITGPTSMIIAILVFGLARSYLANEKTNDRWQNKVKNEISESTNNNAEDNSPTSLSNVVFVAVYIIILIIVGFLSNFNSELFVPWNQIIFTQILQLAASILLCFFVPGYAIVSVIQNKMQIGPVPKVLLAYIFSMAITGFSGFLAAILGFPLSEIKPELITVYVTILFVFIGLKWMKGRSYVKRVRIEDTNYGKVVTILVRKNITEFIVFGSIFALVVLSTYSLYQGVIIGDQWFHHGRSLSFIAGAFKSEAGDTFYPAFFHALLATFFSLSGVPSVNAYASINFLNIIPVFAFYYFFKKWIPNPSWQRASLLACTFFMLSSGFGWINVLTMSTTTNPVNSQLSALEVFHLVETKTIDIRKAGAFVITGSPAPTTGLILIALPAGFLLLGLIREKLNCKFKYFSILVAISAVGVLSHDEFYLFVIIASFLPLIFRLSERKTSVYVALLSSLLLVILVDITSPAEYYTVRQIFGVPIIVLMVLYLGLMWAFYASGIIHRVHLVIKLKRKIPNARRLKLSLGIVIVGIFAYLYLFTFLVWGQLSGEAVQAQQYPFDLPWYLYPMKLGVTGLLGFAFVLSYFFKRFEREVFIFGLIAIIALLLGPYYDEYRFSKYIMAGMGGFASLLIYKIIFAIRRIRVKPLITGLIIGVVISSSSLSVLMFNGYTASAVQYPDFEEFHKHSQRRIFPSSQEIRFFSYLHKDLVNLKTDYVTVPAEYGLDSKLRNFEYQTLDKKIQAFVGSSVASPPKFFQSPFTLNATTLAGLYHLLNYTTTRYIILPKEFIIDAKEEGPIRFALENFQKPYQDSNYIVLTVPSITPPTTSSGDVALIYRPNVMLLSSSVSGEKSLRFNNESLKSIRSSNIAKTGNESEEISAILYGINKSRTIWSNSLQQKEDINYIQSTFRINAENDSATGSTGVVWQDQNKVYYVSLSDRGLQLSQKPIQISEEKETLMSQNAGITKQAFTWYTLKMVMLGNTVDIYLDDALKLQVRTDTSHISKVGIRTSKNIAEFKPLITGQISELSNKSFQKEIYYHLYYPLNEFALSKTAYDTFAYGDFSAFSKRNVMLTWDPVQNDTNFKKYLDFVNEGGKLIVINTDSDFVGGFSKLLSIKGLNETKFDGILQSGEGEQRALGVSGFARAFDFDSLNATVKTFYMNDNQKVAAFALDKSYGDAGGHIIFVNSAGYFDAIFKSPELLFMTLAHIPTQIGLEAHKYTKEILPKGAIPGARFIGDLRISGSALIKSSSLLLPDGSNNFNVGHVSILNNQSGVKDYQYLKKDFKNVLIKDLALSGSYRILVNSAGVAYLPLSSSQYDYIGISLPNRFDMTLQLLDGSGAAEFNISNATGNDTLPVKLTHKAQIQFDNVSTEGTFLKNQASVLMKTPEINASGNITINKLYTPNGPPSSYELNLEGKLIARLDHVDNYLENYHNASRMQYVTYLKWILIKGNTNDKPDRINIPGDISEDAKRKGIDVPWQEVMRSTNSIVLLISIVLITSILTWRLWPKIKKLEGMA